MNNTEAAREMAQAGAALKKHLKMLSKNQLIALLVQQVNLVIEHQNINKILIEKLNAAPVSQSGEAKC